MKRPRYWHVLFLVLIVGYLVYQHRLELWSSSVAPVKATAAAPVATSTAAAPLVLKHDGCISALQLPDPACTPGDVLPVDAKVVCVSGYSQSVRNVPESEKTSVYAAYGVVTHAPGSYEVDHLISLELGGSNEAKNLWPEPYTGDLNAHIKDKVENLLHKLVCNGTMTLQAAQQGISTNWKQFLPQVSQ